MKFKPEHHIVGKVYDLTQENMNAMIIAFEELQKAYDEQEEELDATLMVYDILKKENERLQEALDFTIHAAEYLFKPDKPLIKGLDPTFYFTLTYEGDFDLIEKTRKCRAVLEKSKNI